MEGKDIRWSPISCIPAGPSLSPSGLLELSENVGEVSLLYLDQVQLRVVSDPLPILNTDSSKAMNTQNLDWYDRDSDLICTLTNHRIIFMRKNTNPRFIHLSNVKHAIPDGGGLILRSSPKVILSTYSYGDMMLAFKHPTEGTKQQQEVLTGIKKSVRRRAWEEAQRAEIRKKESHVNKITQRKVGVDAILAKNKARHQEAARISDQAFSGDAEKLLAEAKDLVTIIQKYVATLDNSKTNKKSNIIDEKENQDNNNLTHMLQSMGMTSGLSKESYSENHYFDQLARQIADFLKYKDRLKQAGGMMTLTDVYCLFNRARATNFMSPDDLLNVLPFFDELKLGMSKRAFPSGVIVIQDDEHSDEKMAQELLSYATANSYTGITAMDATKYTKISSLLVNEHLLSAENMGILCRDVTLEGVRFFPNYFATKNFIV